MGNIPAGMSGPYRRFLERLMAGLRSDDRVTALFLGGSHAAGTADEHSDLDLYLITSDAAFESLRSESKDLLQALGEIVVLEEHSDRLPDAVVHLCRWHSR